MITRPIRTYAFLALLVLGAHVNGCSKNVDTSVSSAQQHAPMLAETVAADVAELRRGLPDGASHLATLYGSNIAPKDDLASVRTELERARGKVQDLRVAKSTFFALAELDGTVLRTDRDPDLMSGKNLFAAYPFLKGTIEGRAAEGLGSMPEATGVRGRKDVQFAMAVPVKAGGRIVGIYASGWSMSAYAYRLENALRSELRGRIKDEHDKLPLVYVYLVVEDSVYGAPVSPVVNAEAIRKLEPLKKVTGTAVFTAPLEIEGRDFGLAVRRAPSMGANVAVAVLRSET
ncbi:MAG: hypothetical protein QM784_36220 [Polyangiaceae bacterium]